MQATYILFRKSAKPNPHWVETIEGLENAKRRLSHYMAASSEEYFLFDVNTCREVSLLAKAKSASNNG